MKLIPTIVETIVETIVNQEQIMRDITRDGKTPKDIEGQIQQNKQQLRKENTEAAIPEHMKRCVEQVRDNGVGGQSVEFDCLTGDICARAVVIIFYFIFCYLILELLHLFSNKTKIKFISTYFIWENA